MEFKEKLQQLRKQKGLTQEALADALYVSRAAVSKWESGRGYPGIDTLKLLSEFFEVPIDVLLSGDQVLNIAREDQKQREQRLLGAVFALLDLSTVMLLFLPFFGQKTDQAVMAASLIGLTESPVYLKIAYWLAVIAMLTCGTLGLALQLNGLRKGKLSLLGISLLLNAIGTMLFIISPQPNAGLFFFSFFLIKLLLCRKQQRTS